MTPHVAPGPALLGDALDGGDLAALRDRALCLLASAAETSRT